MKSRKPCPAVFLEAARRIGEQENAFACCAIEDSADISALVELDYFRAILKPWGKDPDSAWYGESLLDVEEPNRTARILGLCLCAQLAKEGFVPNNFSL